jgi:glucose/arabinose dehydrogenase
MVSKLTWNGSSWAKLDLVRGLPRSEENHATNGLALDEQARRLYVAQGGMTNMGAPSARFAYARETQLSGTILSIDLSRLRPPYDVPTGTGRGPFGGDGGRNGGRRDPDGPVRVYASGLRNPYDVLLAESGLLYSVDNGPAYYWGGPPVRSGGTSCGDEPREIGAYGPDVLYVVDEGFYAGHPNPRRGGRECLYGRGRAALATFGTSTNGLAEYTASNFGGALRGDLLAASLDGNVYRIELAAGGRRALSSAPFFRLGGFPLDVVAQHDEAVFPGTIWIADYVSGNLVVEEPLDRTRGVHWEQAAPSGVERQEVSYVRLGDRFYLAGGSGEQEAYDPARDRWTRVAPLPERLDHVQGVALAGRIYYVGGLLRFPEPASSSVLVYDPASDSFTRGTPMPRPRGAGGVAVRDGRIYYAGGLHEGRAVAWFDVYDPRTGSWRRLPDMPRARDHFQAQVAGGRLYVLGGRDSDVDAITAETDAYDFATGRWITGLAPMPTPRAGYASAVVGGEIVTLGGESTERAFSEVEAYDPRRNRWRVLDPMPEPRHGIQGVACGGDVYVAAGGASPYGDAPSDVHSVLVTDPARRCPLARRAQLPSTAAVRFRERVVEAGLEQPTSLQFGPDGRLYVAEQDGTIEALSLHRTPAGQYRILARERIEEVRRIPNHDDDGSSAVGWDTLVRLVLARTGICCEFPMLEPPPVRNRAVRPADAGRGRRLFRLTGCAGCHTFSPAGSEAFSGPPLDHVRSLSPELIREAIVDPNATVVSGYPPDRMPADYGRSLGEQQLADLVAFLRRG